MFSFSYYSFVQKKLRRMMSVWVVVFVILTTFVTSAPQAHADAWGANMAAAIMKQAMEKIYDQIQGVLLGSLKVAAVQMLNSQINQLVGGQSGKPLFITNYDTFLYQDPLQKTNLYMNDFFTLTTRGKSSSANYISVGNTGSEIAGNYTNYLVEQARKATVDQDDSAVKYTLDNYTSDPQAMFNEGNWRGFNSFFSNPANNPFGYTLIAQEEYQNKLEAEQEIASVRAQSSGFVGAESNGQIITPAGSIEALTTRVQNMGNDLITAATNPAEFLSGVVTSMVNKTVTGLIQKGVGQIQSNIQREMGNVTNQINGTLQNKIQIEGPGAQFISDTAQRINTNLNTSTPPPPDNGANGP